MINVEINTLWLPAIFLAGFMLGILSKLIVNFIVKFQLRKGEDKEEDHRPNIIMPFQQTTQQRPPQQQQPIQQPPQQQQQVDATGKVATLGLQKEKGYFYYIDKDGDVSKALQRKKKG